MNGDRFWNFDIYIYIEMIYEQGYDSVTHMHGMQWFGVGCYVMS